MKATMERATKVAVTNKVQNALEKVKDTWIKIKTFFVEVNVEIRKVTWPSFKEVRDTTIVVIIAVFIFGIFLYLVDLALGEALKVLFKRGA
jgi:preprotein translocase subunit SecE